jgi:hypothetical protein
MKMDTNLSDIFDVDLKTTDTSIAELKTQAIIQETSTLEAQREFVRKNLVELIETGKNAIKDLNNIAVDSEKSRDFEVLSTLIKTMVDTNVTLLDIEVAHKVQKPIEDSTQQNATTINNNAVFVGSTADLAAYIKSVTLNNKSH